jgi:hypothetical protein
MLADFVQQAKYRPKIAASLPYFDIRDTLFVRFE